MNRNELIDQIGQRTNLTKKDCGTALDAALETIKTAVAHGEKVSLRGFGSFEPRPRAARTARNPKSGELMNIAAKVVPVFNSAKDFAEAVQNLRG